MREWWGAGNKIEQKNTKNRRVAIEEGKVLKRMAEVPQGVFTSLHLLKTKGQLCCDMKPHFISL